MMDFRGMESNGKNQQPSGGGGFRYLPQTPELLRQSSVCSLTFDEFQNTLGGIGKDFGSMNMDELLKNIWTAEETQAMASAAAAAAATVGLPEASGYGLQRQSSLTLPRTLSQKTVDEVWKDLFKENSVTGGGGGGGGGQVSAGGANPQQRQPTLGEITLEEFLVRAGVVREDTHRLEKPVMPAVGSDSININANNSLFVGDLSGRNTNCNAGFSLLGFPSTAQDSRVAAMLQPIPMENAGANDLEAAYTRSIHLGNQGDLGSIRDAGTTRVTQPSMNSLAATLGGAVGFGTSGATVPIARSPRSTNPLSSEKFSKHDGDLASVSPVPYEFDRGTIKKHSGMERAVERRQKRMIKNRESAARSRARKQAYTIELEAEVAKLKEQNQELQKKQAELLEIQKNQASEIINEQNGSKKRSLRRTQTGPW